MSIAGGFSRAVDRAEQVQATALQVFVKSARQWDAKPGGAEEAPGARGKGPDQLGADCGLRCGYYASSGLD